MPRVRSLAASLPALFLLGACGGGSLDTESVDVPRSALPRQAVATAPTPTAVQLLNWAQANYPAQFPPNWQVAGTSTYAGYEYRHYESTGNYLGVADGAIYVMGPVVGSTSVPVIVGRADDYACTLNPLACQAVIGSFDDSYVGTWTMCSLNLKDTWTIERMAADRLRATVVTQTYGDQIGCDGTPVYQYQSVVELRLTGTHTVQWKSADLFELVRASGTIVRGVARVNGDTLEMGFSQPGAAWVDGSGYPMIFGTGAFLRVP